MSSNPVSRRLAAGVIAAGLLSPALARARSLKAFEAGLMQRDIYFQPMDEPAPDFALQDADGHAVTLGSLRGKTIVLNFIYTRCPDICPLQTERMAQIQRMIKPLPVHDRMRLISVTADPVHDTPEVIKAYAKQHGMDPTDWLFLTSGPAHPEATRALSARYHSRFQAEPDGSFTHGTVFHVIDTGGQWRGNFHGLKWRPEDLVQFATALADPGSIPGPSFLERLEHLF